MSCSHDQSLVWTSRKAGGRHVRSWMGLCLSLLCVMPGGVTGSAFGDHSHETGVTMSSPEEIHEVSSLQFHADEVPVSASETFVGALTGGATISPILFSQGGPAQPVGLLPTTKFQKNAGNSAASPLSPLLTDGIFPYQANPIGAVISAGLTLAVMSLKETGKIDLDGILFLLNSTDFYAGLAGTISGSMGQQTAKSLVNALGRGLNKMAPEMLEPLKQKEALKVFGNIINGFTYSFSVSAGYETFSQFWKIATRNIPEAHTMTGFISSPMHVKKRVALNLMYYTTIDKNLQKRILDSVWNHRIMTFEFIAMNVGLYVGAQLGNYIAATQFPGNVWAKRTAPIIGSVALGVLIQMMPDSWKAYFNEELLDWKIARQTRRLEKLEETVLRGLKQLDYPAESVSGIGSYWSSGVDLSDDIERLIGVRDLLVSLKMQKWLAHQDQKSLSSAMLETYHAVHAVVESGLKQATQPQPSLAAQIDRWIAENKSPEEIQRLSIRYYQADPKRLYYGLVLEAARDRMDRDLEEFNAFQRVLESP